jgi:Flp pilus assembly protein TadD
VRKTYSWENLQDFGIKQYRVGNFTEAILNLEKANEKNPNHPETICALGESYLQQSIKIENTSILTSQFLQKKQC